MFPQHLIAAVYQAHIERRRALRVDGELRSATSEEWAEFEQHFLLRRVRTGAEALHAQLGDVVLVDLGLPDIDGRGVRDGAVAAAGAQLLAVADAADTISVTPAARSCSSPPGRPIAAA